MNPLMICYCYDVMIRYILAYPLNNRPNNTFKLEKYPESASKSADLCLGSSLPPY